MKNKILILMTVLVMLFSHTAAAKTAYNWKNFPAQVQVTTSALNVRSGPGTYFKIVGTVYNGNILECVGKLGTWFVVHLDNDTVGLISGTYSKAYYPPAPSTPKPPAATPAPTKTPAPPATSLTPTSEEQQMLNLVNQERAKNGLKALTMNADLLKVARLKSQDMVNLNYFSHTSPTYGSPFQMLKDFGISYKTAGENIAANSSVSAAHTSLMNSSGHRANILNGNYNLVGIGVVNSPKYGKMITQIFVGR
jgi:uncharacterized YkwD family protein